MRIGLFLLLSGCASTAAWRPVAEIPHAKSASAKGGAVFIENEIAFVGDWHPGKPPVYLEKHHALIQVLDKNGLGLASQRILLGPHDHLQMLQARTISPSGIETEVDPKTIYTDTVTSEGSDYRYEIFRFPNTEVGSRLEMFVAVDHDDDGRAALFGLSAPISASVPTERFRLDLVLGKTLDYALKTYNRAPAFGVQETPNQHNIFLQMLNVPAAADEWLAPPWRDDQPWWAYRTRYFREHMPALATWADALSGVAHALYDEKMHGAPPRVDDNRPVKQRIEEALSEVRTRTTFSGFANQPDSKEGVGDALSRGTANNFDKAAVFYALLKAHGVPAQFALTGRDRSRVFDPEFPLWESFDHALVWVPGEDGGFIDPSCEACAIGQMAWWSAGRTAAIISDTGGGAPTVFFVPISGTPPAPTTQSKMSEATLSADGTLSAHVTVALSGKLAVTEEFDQRKLNAQKRHEHDEHEIHLPAKWSTKSSPKINCDRQTARCTLDAEATGASYAPSASDRWLVPLDFLSLAVDAHSLDERARDLFISEPETFDESLVMHVPAGFALAELPKNADEKSNAFDVHVGFRQEADPKSGATITIHRTLKMKAGRYKVDSLSEAAHALATFVGTRKQTLVLVKH